LPSPRSWARSGASCYTRCWPECLLSSVPRAWSCSQPRSSPVGGPHHEHGLGSELVDAERNERHMEFGIFVQGHVPRARVEDDGESAEHHALINEIDLVRT